MPSLSPGFKHARACHSRCASVFQSMVLELLPVLKRGSKMKSRSVSCDIGEGTLAAALGAIQDRFPDIEIGDHHNTRLAASAPRWWRAGQTRHSLRMLRTIRQADQRVWWQPFELRPEDSVE